MNEQGQAKVVELVLPRTGGPEPAGVPPASNSWWIPAVVVAVLIGNAGLVWWRVKGRDPVKRAFAAAAGRAGLTGAEKKRVEEMAGVETSPVALLISEAAMERAAAGSEDPLMVSVRRKLREARA